MGFSKQEYLSGVPLPSPISSLSSPFPYPFYLWSLVLQIFTKHLYSDPLLGIGIIHNTNPDSILKSRDITLPTKVCIVKAMVFQVVMYGLEKAMAPHSSALAWKIPWMEEPGRL